MQHVRLEVGTYYNGTDTDTIGFKLDLCPDCLRRLTQKALQAMSGRDRLPWLGIERDVPEGTRWL